MHVKDIITESADIYDLQDRLERSGWRKNVRNVLTDLFSQRYPQAKVYFANSNMGGLFVTTDKNNLADQNVMQYYSDPTDHFNASIIGPMIEQDETEQRYVGYGFDSISSGKFKGIVVPMLQTLVPPLAKKLNAQPAVMIAVEDQSAGVWSKIAQKLGWKYFNPELGLSD